MESNKILRNSILIILLIITVFGGIFFGFLTAEIKNFSGIKNLKKFQPSVPTKIYDVNGELIAELFQEKRSLVSYEQIPQTTINAFLATEDQEFYDHFGINPIAIFRAMIKNIMAGRVVQGGSTITQQLAKRLFTQGQKTLTRKILEAILALQIEKKFSKQEILEMYFNQIYFGHGCYGIGAASKLYFNKDVEFLSLAESSILAALPSAPHRYSPLRNPENAYFKNRDIISRMVKEGYISQEKADHIKNVFWPAYLESIKTEYPTKTANSKTVDKAPYFTDYVRRILISRFGKNAIYNEGLHVYTTLDLKRQSFAEHHLQTGLKNQNKTSSEVNKHYDTAFDRTLFDTYENIRRIFNLPAPLVKRDLETQYIKFVIDNLIDSADILTLFGNSVTAHNMLETFRGNAALNISSSLKVEGAIIAMEHSTGYITSMVGGSKFSVDNQYNRAIQARRQPGSSFKPFVYGAAIDSKIITAATTIPDAPMLNIDAQGDTWTPGNYGGKYSGLTRIRRALARSINIISIRLFDMLGSEKIIDFASRILKIPHSRFNPNPSMALGTNELTPFELASAYSIYANKGRDVIPFAIRYILDRDGFEIANIEEEVGNIIATKEKDGTIQVVPEEVAYIMTSLMQDVVDHGTATDMIRNQLEFKNDAAGKTGTTSNWTDAWFCGFTPEITTVVWAGYDKQFMSLGPHQSGGRVAAPIWGKYMKDIYNGMPESKFSKEAPENVYHASICAYSGKLPVEGTCEETISEIFIRGSGSIEECDGNHYKMQSILERYIEKEGLAEDSEETKKAQ